MTANFLTYPLELENGMNDFVSFTSSQWRPNMNHSTDELSDGAEVEGQHTGQNYRPPSSGPVIRLYMPTTTPAVSQGANWSETNFQGQLGELMRNGGIAAANLIESIDPSKFGSFDEAKQQGGKAIENLKGVIDQNKGLLMGAGKQFGINAVGSFIGTNANGLMALSRGKIYNPNVELLYQGPQLRSFSFTFQFAPKSPKEAADVNRIILEFKKWSAAKETGNGMYEVPHVWQVKYHTATGVNTNMNVFKRAALRDISVQDNQGMNMHMTFPDGQPIVKTMSLTFQEVDVITRDDHMKSGSSVGY